MPSPVSACRPTNPPGLFLPPQPLATHRAHRGTISDAPHYLLTSVSSLPQTFGSATLSRGPSATPHALSGVAPSATPGSAADVSPPAAHSGSDDRLPLPCPTPPAAPHPASGEPIR